MTAPISCCQNSQGAHGIKPVGDPRLRPYPRIHCLIQGFCSRWIAVGKALWRLVLGKPPPLYVPRSVTVVSFLFFASFDLHYRHLPLAQVTAVLHNVRMCVCVWIQVVLLGFLRSVVAPATQNTVHYKGRLRRQSDPEELRLSFLPL